MAWCNEHGCPDAVCERQHLPQPPDSQKLLLAAAAMAALTPEQRETVMMGFCRGCYRQLERGERCYCMNDE